MTDATLVLGGIALALLVGLMIYSLVTIQRASTFRLLLIADVISMAVFVGVVCALLALVDHG